MLVLAASLLCLPSADWRQDEFRPARVGNAPLAVHATFKETTPVLDELAPATPLRVVEERPPWLRVEVPAGLPVWVHKDFVRLQGGTGILPSSKVRARPLPSTGPESYPVGKFQKGDEVRVLAKEGDWVRVIAPEHLAGWVKAEGVQVYSNRPGDWSELWSASAAERRLALSRDAAEGAVSADPKPVVAEAAAAPTALKPQPRTEPAQPAQPARQAGEKEPAQAGTVSPETLESQLLGAEVELAALSSGGYDAGEAEQLRARLGAILWAAEDKALQQRTRESLARLEALQHAHDLSEQLERKQAHFEAVAAAADAAAKEKEAGMGLKPPPGPLEAYSAVGWLEHRPGQALRAPYALVRGGNVQSVQVEGGRYDLRDYLGREVAVHGTWRTGGDGRSVLQIERLRVLPRR